MWPNASRAALLVLFAATPPGAGDREPERAEYAVRWDPSEGGPRSAGEVLQLLGSPETAALVFEVRYFDLPPPPGAPPDSATILRSRRRADGKAEIRLKFRRSSPLRQPFRCPEGAAFDASEEVDYGFRSDGSSVRVYAYSCTLEAESPPAFLAATPKPCASRMERYVAGDFKVEEWWLPGGGRQLEVSRAAANGEAELSRFQAILGKLRARGVRPSARSKTEAGSDCPPAGAPGARPEESSPGVALPPELSRVLTDYEAAWRTRDAAALARLFAEEGFVLASGQPPVRGRAAIEKAYAGAGGPLVLRAFAYATEGSVGYILGNFARREGEPDVGKFTLTLKKAADGRWEIFSDMDNGNRQNR